MKRLHLLRHAKALSVAGKGDHARPLAPRGIWAAEAVAENRATQLGEIDIALCSSAIRARETLRLFERYLPRSCEVTFDDALYLADGREHLSALRLVDDRHDTALFVGHEPGLSELAHALCGGAGRARAVRRLAKGLKTAGLATIDLDVPSWRKLRHGDGSLRAYTRPKDVASSL